MRFFSTAEPTRSFSSSSSCSSSSGSSSSPGFMVSELTVVQYYISTDFFFFPFFLNIFVPLLLFLWLRFPFRLPFLFFDSSSWFLYSLSVLCCCCVSADDIALNLQHHLASPPSPWPLLSHPAARFPPPFPIDMQMPPEAQ